jgi:hypothetical protein
MPKDIENNMPDRLRSIIRIDDNKLSEVFNYYITHSAEQPHAKAYWDELFNILNQPPIDKDKVIFLIKYLLLDSFGCSVPVFIEIDCDFQKNNTTQKIEFSYIHFGINDYCIISKESHSGW